MRKIASVRIFTRLASINVSDPLSTRCPPSTNGHARVLFPILSAVSEAERKRVRERVLDIKCNQVSRSRFFGGSVPFGYKLEQEEGAKLVEIPKQQDAIKAMIRLKNDGLLLQEISEVMNIKGFYVSHVAVSHARKRESYL